MKNILFALLSFMLSAHAYAWTVTPVELQRLKDSYPEAIQSINNNKIIWKDGTVFTVVSDYSLVNKLFQTLSLYSGMQLSIKDLKCDSYESVFKKMYGENSKEVLKHLRTIYWMPHVFGHRYPLKVTTVNGVDKKLEHISAKLEKLPKSFHKYLNHIGGSFYWRTVEQEKYLSSHSFGIALDINTHYGNYWLWDVRKAKSKTFNLTMDNKIPKEIVDIFEQEGFLWGGRWAYYDTMHFEYRPELFKKDEAQKLVYNHELGLRCDV